MVHIKSFSSNKLGERQENKIKKKIKKNIKKDKRKRKKIGFQLNPPPPVHGDWVNVTVSNNLKG